MSKFNLNGFLAERIFDTPLLIEPGRGRIIANYLEQRMMGNLPAPVANLHDDEEEEGGISGVIDGVAIVPIVGTLVHRGGFMDADSGILSYRQIRQELIAAADDPTINSIVLDIDSGGGEVEGTFDLARLIRQVNDEIKPVIAIANGSAFSAAYALGAAAGAFFMTETGGVGSIGTIIQHIDFSEQNKMLGIKVTNITFGDKKDEFSSDSPLSEEALQTIQERINTLGEIFVNHVVDMRGISRDVVINTEAALIFSAEAVKLNFVDGISSFDELLENLIDTEFPIGPIETRERISQMFPKSKAKKEALEEKAGTEPKGPNAAPEDIEKATAQPAAEEPAAPAATSEEPVAAPANSETNDDPAANTDPVERAAMISELCETAGMSSLAPEFMRGKLSLEDIKDRLDEKQQIKQACILAGKPDRAEEFIKAGVKLSNVQKTLIDERAAVDDEQPEVSGVQKPEDYQEDLKAAATGENVVMANAIKRREEAEAKAKVAA